MLSPELQNVVDKLCEDGCTKVRGYIGDIQAGEIPANMRDLSGSERAAVLSELQAVMSVYDRKNK